MKRHVWVRPPFHATDHPGLLLDWRERDGRTEMLVTYFLEADGRAVTDWMPREQVRPA